jgi:hypothetical protein
VAWQHTPGMLDVDRLAQQVLSSHVNLTELEQDYSTRVARYREMRREWLQRLLTFEAEYGGHPVIGFLKDTVCQGIRDGSTDVQFALACEIRADLIQRLSAEVGPRARLSDLCRLRGLEDASKAGHVDEIINDIINQLVGTVTAQELPESLDVDLYFEMQNAVCNRVRELSGLSQGDGSMNK